MVLGFLRGLGRGDEGQALPDRGRGVRPVRRPARYRASGRRAVHLREPESPGLAFRSYLEFSPSYESFLSHDGIEASNGLHRFHLARKHQGHPYYEGASGSPIFAPDGTIVSMLLGGFRETDVLYGLPLSRHPACVGIGEVAVRR